MAQKSLRLTSTLYKGRFWLGYGFLIVALVGLLSLSVLQVSSGLSTAEQESVLKSAALTLKNPSSFMIVDLPYHALQKASISFFGLNSISIKLPSILIAFVSSIGLVLLLRRWLQPRTSVITGAIAITSTPFIFLAQQGTPAIMSIFWPIAIILLVIWSTKNNKFRTITLPLLSLMIALSLYTPLMSYIIVALILGSIAHPYARLLLRRRIPKYVIAISFILSFMLLIPLGYIFLKSPLPAKSLLISQVDSSFDAVARLKESAMQFIDITGSSIATTGNLAPYFTLATLALMCIGVFNLFKQRHTIQSYVLTAWFITAIVVVALNPGYPEVLFVPTMLLSGLGISTLLHEWYKLFPQNPYARAFALIPLSVLIGGIMLTGAARYFYLYSYNPGLIQANAQDLRLMHQTIKSGSVTTPSFIAVSNDELPFYKLYIDTNKIKLQVTTEGNIDKISTSDKTRILATKNSALASSKVIPESVIASPLNQKPSDRFYVYKNTAK